MTRLQKASLAVLSIGMAIFLVAYYNSVIATETGQEQPLTLVCVTCAAEATEGNTEPLIERYTATAYCGCEKCCGKWALNREDGIVVGSSGIELEQGVSVASGLPAGTVIKVSDADHYNGIYTVHDKPADWILDKYDNKIIDFYFNDHADALEFGKRSITVEIVEVEK